jgi:hypothetical protein
MLLFASRRSSRVGTFSSRLPMPSTKSPDTRKLSASTRIANGARSSSTRTPAAAGPPSCAPERLISSFEFPSTSCSRSTSDGRYDWYATSKNTVQMPTRNPTAYSCQIVRTSSPYAAGTVPRRTARPRSPAIRIGRRGSLSTHTPAGREIRRNGANSTTSNAETSNALTSRVITATSGSARPVTCDPNWLIVSADHSFRKSPCRQSPPEGQSRRTTRSGIRLNR